MRVAIRHDQNVGLGNVRLRVFDETSQDSTSASAAEGLNGNFNAGSFARISGGGPAAPSFDGVTATTCGFAAGNPPHIDARTAPPTDQNQARAIEVATRFTKSGIELKD